MLTPSLACAMPVCADEAKAVAVKEHCADHAPGKAKQDKKSGKVTFLKDCMGLEFQAADKGPAVQKPDQVKSFSFIIPADINPVSTWTLSDIGGIRGPPPDWSDHSQIQPSILLTTQRFRI